ncbi:hypothetical protein [Agromyces sp. LHK192]|uniref:hypothetical protein n=1 Tax=Agromyces sp. LHK192 TaxID=2498704 RepID=UPI000FD820A7|nr:hypothetical protein [Agromyces sp. LHK192]
MQRAGRRDRGALRIDPRLALGLLLVAGSSVGVWALVDGLDTTTRVYAVAESVPTGTRLEASDLVEVSVRLGAAAERYVVPGDLPESGAFTTRTIEAGELLPRSAVAEREASDLATLVVPVRGAVPGDAGPGDRVDVWTAKRVDQQTFEPPSVLVPDAEISAVLEPEGAVAGGDLSIELLVPRAKVAAVLQALAAGDAVDVVGAQPGRADR